MGCSGGCFSRKKMGAHTIYGIHMMIICIVGIHVHIYAHIVFSYIYIYVYHIHI